MTKQELDKLALQCRKLGITWQTGKNQDEHSISIELDLTTSNYHLIAAIFNELERQKPEPLKLTPEQGASIFERKKRRGTSGNWGEVVAGK